MQTVEALQTLLMDAEPTLKFQEAYTFLVNKELDELEVEYLQKCFPELELPDSILSEEKLNKLLALIQQRLNDIEHAENVIFVIGSTGSGKSSLINHLCDIPMSLKRDESEEAYLDPDAGAQALIKMGRESKTETVFPKIVKYKNISYVECPAVTASYYDELSVLSDFATQQAIRRAKKTLGAIVIIDRANMYRRKLLIEEKNVDALLKLNDRYANKYSNDLNDLAEIPIFFTVSRPHNSSEDQFDVDIVQTQLKNKMAMTARGRVRSIDDLKKLIEQKYFHVKLAENFLEEIKKGEYLADKMTKLTFALEFMEKIHKTPEDKNVFAFLNDLLKVLPSGANDFGVLISLGDSLSIFIEELKSCNFKLEQELKYQTIFARLVRSSSIYVFRGYKNPNDTDDHKQQLVEALHALPHVQGLEAVAVSPSNYHQRLFSANNMLASAISASRPVALGSR